MFGLGIPELLVILVVALLVFGPGRLPEVGNALGRGVRDFREALTGKDGDGDGDKAPELGTPADKDTDTNPS